MDKRPDENKYFTTHTKKKIIIYLTVISVGLILFFLLSKVESFSKIYSTLAGIMAPVTYGVAMAYLLNPLTEKIRKPLNNFLTGKMKNKILAGRIAKGSAITLSVACALAFITAFLWLIIPELYESVVKLIGNAPGYLKNLQDWYTNEIDSGAEWTIYIKGVLDSGIEALEKWLSEDLLSTLNSAIGYLTSGVIGVVNFLINFTIGIIIAVYALIEKDRFVGQSKKFIYAMFKTERANSILETARHGHKIFGSYMSGKIVCCIFVGIITFIFMAICNMPYSILISFILAVTNIIPFLGPFLGAIPSAFLILLIDPLKCLWFIIFVIVLQQIEGNIIEPKVVGTTTGISEFWITFALFLFGGLFGFTGMVIGVPLFAVIYYITREFVNNKIKARGLPLDASEYYNTEKINPETLELQEKEEPVKIKKEKKKKNK